MWSSLLVLVELVAISVAPACGRRCGLNLLVGTIEVGHLAFSPAVQATTAATEVMALMMRTVFDELGYRRYEGKCDGRKFFELTTGGRAGLTRRDVLWAEFFTRSRRLLPSGPPVDDVPALNPLEM